MAQSGESKEGFVEWGLGSQGWLDDGGPREARSESQVSRLGGRADSEAIYTKAGAGLRK